MVVILLILLSLGVALFIMLSDTRRNNRFAELDKAARGDAARVADANGTADGSGDGSD